MAHSAALIAFARPQRHGFHATVHSCGMQGRTALVGICLMGLTMGCGGRRPCGAEPGHGAAAASYGVRRAGETVAAMQVLGLRWSKDPHDTDVFLLGYPNLGLAAIASAASPWMGDSSGLHHTYAEDFDGREATCDGDLRHLLDGRHSELTARALSADLDALLALTQPTDIYTHAEFDGHPDHAEVHRQVVAALERSGKPVVLHSTLIHPEGTGDCMPLSAEQWPNPALTDNDPFARFTPALDVTAPPVPPCAVHVEGTRWGPLGPPDELVEVPREMQEPDPERNLKWRALARYASQVDCARHDDGSYHPSCGYMRAFVKRHEFFWTRRFGDVDRRDAMGPVLVVAAHPDDEALGAAGIIASARAAGRRVFVAVVTVGDPRPPSAQAAR